MRWLWVEVVPLPQAGQSLLMELRLPEEFWILLWIPSMRRCGFTPGPKDIPLSSRRSPCAGAVLPAQGISSCVHWPGLFPGQGSLNDPSNTNPSLPPTDTALCARQRERGHLSPLSTLQSQPAQQSCPELIQPLLVTCTAPFPHPQSAHSPPVQILLNGAAAPSRQC